MERLHPLHNDSAAGDGGLEQSVASVVVARAHRGSDFVDLAESAHLSRAEVDQELGFKSRPGRMGMDEAK